MAPKIINPAKAKAGKAPPQPHRVLWSMGGFISNHSIILVRNGPIGQQLLELDAVAISRALDRPGLQFGCHTFRLLSRVDAKGIGKGLPGPPPHASHEVRATVDLLTHQQAGALAGHMVAAAVPKAAAKAMAGPPMPIPPMPPIPRPDTLEVSMTNASTAWLVR